MTNVHMPVLETERLLIRPFVADDGPAVARVMGVTDADGLLRNQRYVEQGMAVVQQLADLYQPPIGDRAVVLKESQIVIGVVGLTPAFGPFDQLVLFDAPVEAAQPAYNRPEIGLFYEFDPHYRRQGYATEAAHALVKFVFDQLYLKQIVATTEYDNHGSMGVMRKLGMTLYQNPLPEPHWFQVVGILRKEEYDANP
jgi:RimJ/RimL family protein N-acetyltransferase